MKRYDWLKFEIITTEITLKSSEIYRYLLHVTTPRRARNLQVISRAHEGLPEGTARIYLQITEDEAEDIKKHEGLPEGI